MKVMFTGDPHGNDTSTGVRMFERLFPMGQEVDVTDMPLDQQKKLAGNSHFVASGAPGEQPGAPEKKKKG